MPCPMDAVTNKCSFIPSQSVLLYFGERNRQFHVTDNGRFYNNCLKVFISVCLCFDLLVNVLCLEIP